MSTCFLPILAYCIMIPLMRIGFYVVRHSLKFVSSSHNGNSPRPQTTHTTMSTPRSRLPLHIDHLCRAIDIEENGSRCNR
ncbi:hypothetical protein F5Y06DRAFT_262285 [Hypoxylon sp. FL0890]|nr:hypothetical protein F5Y06DRAFT_262285 [Hypoxylon sp. FL0890]